MQLDPTVMEAWYKHGGGVSTNNVLVISATGLTDFIKFLAEGSVKLGVELAKQRMADSLTALQNSVGDSVGS